MKAIVSGKTVKGAGINFEVITDVAIPNYQSNFTIGYTLECNGIYFQGFNSPDFAIVNLNSSYGATNSNYIQCQLGFFTYNSSYIQYKWLNYTVFYKNNTITFSGTIPNGKSEMVSNIVSRIQLIKIS